MIPGTPWTALRMVPPPPALVLLSRMGLLALAATLATAACAGPAPPGAPGPHRARASLSGPDVVAIARLLGFEDARSYDPAAFQEIVSGGDVEVRRRAASAAGRIGDPAAVSLLIRLLSDPEPAVRVDAAFALGLLGEGTPTVLDALEGAVPGGWIPAREDEVPVVVEAIAALGRLGGETAATRVRAALEAALPLATDRHRRVAAEALLTVWKFDDGPANVRAAAPYLESADPGLRWRAAYALMRGGDPTALPLLLALDDPATHQVRAYTARALTASAAATAGVETSARDWLVAALSDPHPHVRVNAVRGLAGYGERAPLAPVAALLRDPEASVGVAAAGALGIMGARSAPALLDALEDAQLPVALRGAALEALASVDPAAGARVIRRWTGRDARHRYFAARALGALSGQPVLELGRLLAGDAEVTVAVPALSALAQNASREGAGEADRREARRLLVEAARAADSARRAAAVDFLSELVEPGDVDLLVGVVRRAERDPGAGSTARAAAVSAIGALERLADRPGADPSRIAGRLFAAPAPTDPWILRAAAAIGDGWGPPPDVERSPDFYEGMVRRYIIPPLEGARGPRARIETDRGAIVLELLGDEAPLTVHNFLTLAVDGYFDRGVWHRVVPNFVLQDGAPAGHAEGGPGWSIRDEINRVRYDRGVLGMALSGPDTGGSQWFITHSPQPHLDGGYTVFGRVLEGMAVADAVLQGEPIHAITVAP